MNAKRDVIKLLGTARDLPTLPLVLQKLQQTLNDPNAGADRVGSVIKDDPAMTSRILRVVNSAFYASREPVTSLQLATARLGLKAVSNIAMATSVFSSFSKQNSMHLDREAFWRHSICTGIAANVIYEHCRGNLRGRYSRDMLHLAGILHDIGKILLDQYLHADYALALQATQATPTTLTLAESEIFTLDHAAVGAWLGMKWQLAPDFLQVIRWHHTPENADVSYAEVVMMINAANYICNIEHIGDGGDLAAPVFHHPAWGTLGLAVKDISPIVDEVSTEAQKSEILMAFARA